MKQLRTFFMEDFLENHRFQSKYNLGESGGHPRTVQELLTESAFSEKEIFSEFWNMKLNDSPNRGRDDLREIVSSFHPGSTKENVLITTGTSEALFLLFRYLKPKSVALPIPAFQLLYELPISLNAQIIPLPIRFDENGVPFYDDKEWFEILETNKPDCILINHPHNPSGLCFSSKFLEVIQNYCQKNSVTLIGDEHYRFLSSETEILGPTLYSNEENTFITGSFIKCLGCPGLRIGWILGPKNVLDKLQNEKNYITHTVSPITEWMSVRILQNINSQLFFNMKKEWLQNKKVLGDFLKQSPSVYGVVPEGGLVCSLGIRTDANVLDSLGEWNILFQKLVEAGIFVLPLQSMEFGEFHFQKEKYYSDKKLSLLNLGVGFRLGLGCQPELFQAALGEILVHEETESRQQRRKRG